MKKVSIVYFSGTGVTDSLVKAAIEELVDHSICVFTHQILGSQIVDGRFINTEIFSELHNSDAIIFASPTYMGGVAAQFKAFADATSDFWEAQTWAGKYAAGITCGSAPNGDQTVTLQYLSTLASQHGMLWVGLDIAHSNADDRYNRLGSQMGVIAHAENSTVNERDLNTVKYLAKRLSKIIADA